MVDGEVGDNLGDLATEYLGRLHRESGTMLAVCPPALRRVDFICLLIPMGKQMKSDTKSLSLPYVIEL